MLDVKFEGDTLEIFRGIFEVKYCQKCNPFNITGPFP